jgi:hypothetical protein
MLNRSSMAVCALLFAAILPGCGEPRPEFATVEGVVKVNGNPQGGLAVRFTPSADKGNVFPANASGITDDQGKYSLQYEYKGEIGPGTSIGWHRVTVFDTNVGVTLQGQQSKPPSIPFLYADLSKTPLEAEVKAGETNSIPLELKK